jgi:glycine/D-amino acid oxidase-like deaminating enzyme
MTETLSLPSRARVVIIGGGVIGASVAYHLAQLGWTDVLLLEQGQLSCGTTWSSTPASCTSGWSRRPACPPAFAGAEASPWPARLTA